MRLEVHVPQDVNSSEFVEILKKEAWHCGFELRRNAGELIGFEVTTVVTSPTESGRDDTESPPVYRSISTEVYTPHELRKLDD